MHAGDKNKVGGFSVCPAFHSKVRHPSCPPPTLHGQVSRLLLRPSLRWPTSSFPLRLPPPPRPPRVIAPFPLPSPLGEQLGSASSAVSAAGSWRCRPAVAGQPLALAVSGAPGSSAPILPPSVRSSWRSPRGSSFDSYWAAPWGLNKLHR